MLPYYADLVERAFWAIPGLLGSNTLGLIWPIIIVICGEAIACFAYGWRTVLAKWKQASLIGFASLGVCYTFLFAWSVLSIGYQDHATLDFKNRNLQSQVDAASADKNSAVLLAENKCAETVGENKALGNQNRDQQNSINNCQTQAIKLLQPQPFQWRAVALETPERTQTSLKIHWLLLANKDISPAEFTFNCSIPIVEATTEIAGTSADARTVQIDKDHWGAQIRSPAWGPNSPAIVITTFSPSDAHTTCNFKLETVVK